MLDQRFDPKAAEADIYARWEAKGCFKPSGDTSAEAYSIVIPPPNVTGVLHMGHAFNNSLQDVLIRFERMRGKNVLWQPGTDHAGIATQMVVERQMAEDGGKESRASLGREAFVERVWEWKEESGGQIITQLKRLGASCDWSREKFTMGEAGAADDQMVEAVRKVFVELYNKGLIYRDKRMVNWDPHFQTAISDLEVENRETPGHFWHFKYMLADGETYEYVETDEGGKETLRETRDYISIATTRPETMLGDGAVAVHPDDERYAPIVGKMVHLPLCDRLIPIIKDEYPDPDFGSGAVKITGAHDMNDHEVAKRNDLPMYQLMDEKGAMKASDIMPEKYVGMDRFDARKAVVADIDALGLLIEVEDKMVSQPFGDRSNVVIEPMLTDQWYVDAKTLAEPAIKAVEDGTTRFVPENYTKIYYNWMREIQPWCISRQLWWGHRIPAWWGYAVDDDGRMLSGEKWLFVASTERDALEKARLRYPSRIEVRIGAAQDQSAATRGLHPDPGARALGFDSDAPPGDMQLSSIELFQDTDVLDTWFSSALWPFSTQGWPDKTNDLATFYPTATLVTAHDIIFFWVARMMMQGIEFMGEVPFKDVYIHALVLDEHGQKMSKSKGNAMDPLELVDEYGADALRFSLISQAAQGRNIRISSQRVEGYRNFSTKLWNAARFTEMNECVYGEDIDPAALTQPVNQWIVGELARTAAAVTDGIEKYRFNEAADANYRFIWNIYCDWYLELIKPLLNGEDEAAKTETRRVAGWVLDQILKLLHPFMPFVTEAIWEQIADKRPGFLMLADWPTYGDNYQAKDADAEMDWVMNFISEIRTVRGDLNVSPGAKPGLAIVAASDETKARLARHEGVLMRLARLEDITLADAAPTGTVSTVLGEATLALKVADVIDLAEEKARLEKRIAEHEADIAGIDKKLANENFVSRAPKAVVEEQHTRRTEANNAVEKLNAALTRLQELE